jgi:hypothetical protein
MELAAALAASGIARKLIFLATRRTPHQHPCQNAQRKKGEHASLGGEVCGGRWGSRTPLRRPASRGPR